MQAESTLYEILGVAESANSKTIEDAYKRVAQRWDVGKNQSNFAQAKRQTAVVNDAFATLRDPLLRDRYDAALRCKRGQAQLQTEPRPASSLAATARLPSLAKQAGDFGVGFFVGVFSCALVWLGSVAVGVDIFADTSRVWILLTLAIVTGALWTTGVFQKIIAAKG